MRFKTENASYANASFLTCQHAPTHGLDDELFHIDDRTGFHAQKLGYCEFLARLSYRLP